MTRTFVGRFEMDDWLPPVVLLVGMGTGPADLSALALRYIERAEVLVGGKRHLESFPHHRGRRMVLGRSVEESLAEVDVVSRSRRTASKAPL